MKKKRRKKSAQLPASIRRQSLFYKTFGMLAALGLFSVVIFALFINSLVVRTQTERINELNLAHIERIGDDVDLRLSLLADNVSQSLWSTDFISLMVNPEQSESDLAYRVTESLSGYVQENLLVDETFLYLPITGDVYLSEGVWHNLEEEDLEQSSVITYYDEIREDSDEVGMQWKVLMLGGDLYFVAEFGTPQYIGTFFARIDTEELGALVQDDSNVDSPVMIYDENGFALLDGDATLDYDSFEVESLFLAVDGEENSKASYYLYTSELSGWHYVMEIDSDVGVGFAYILGVMLPFLVLYAIVSQSFALYITRSVYQPINRLLQITSDQLEQDGRIEEKGKIRNEVDYLELVYQDTLEENQQHRELMAAISNDLAEQLFRNILTGRVTDREQIDKTLRASGLEHLLKGRYQAIAGVMSYPEDREISGVERELYCRNLIAILDEIKSDKYWKIALFGDQERLCVCLCFLEDTSVLQVKQAASELLSRIEEETKNLPYRVVLGRGKVYNELTALRYSYQEALQEAGYRRYLEDAGENAAAEPGGEDYDKRYFKERCRKIAEAVESGRREEAETLAVHLVQEIREEKGPDQDIVYYELIVDEIIDRLIAGHLTPEELREQGLSHSLDDLKMLSTAEERAEYTTNFLETAIRAIQKENRKNRYKYVEEAKEYIASRYSDGNLSLNEVSEAIGISAPYLSGVFSEVTKGGFSTYLNSYRVEQAKQFLDQTSQSISSIGYKCGFNSAQSFSRVFKKFTGFTPSQYREHRKEERSGQR